MGSPRFLERACRRKCPLFQPRFFGRPFLSRTPPRKLGHVFTLHCTARLTKRLRATPHLATRETTTRLGNWYANLIHLGRQQLVLAVSEKTLLSIVVPAAPSATLVPRMRGAVADVLRALGVSRVDIRVEEEAMADVVYAKPTDRRALGVLVDFAKTLPYYLEDGGTLFGVALKLARTPCGPLHKTSVFPDRATVALFGVASLRIVR